MSGNELRSRSRRHDQGRGLIRPHPEIVGLNLTYINDKDGCLLSKEGMAKDDFVLLGLLTGLALIAFLMFWVLI